MSAPSGAAPVPGGAAGPTEDAPPRRAATAPPAPRRYSSAHLFGPARLVEIDHGGAVYQLKLTAQGKLILTK